MVRILLAASIVLSTAAPARAGKVVKKTVRKSTYRPAKRRQPRRSRRRVASGLTNRHRWQAEDATRSNRKSWDAANVAHISHKPFMAAYLGSGGFTLNPEEVGLMGDVNGKDVLHLQCNCGEDSLSIAQLGANVTGVDISGVAVKRAQAVSKQSGIKARFERGDVYKWLNRAAHQRRKFDVVFASYGAIMWLRNLPKWSRGISRVLRPGGRLVVVDYHPALDGYDSNWNPVQMQSGQVIQTDGVGDYVGMAQDIVIPQGFATGVTDFKNPHPDFTYHWTTQNLIDAFGLPPLHLELFQEYHYANGAPSMAAMERSGRRWLAPKGRRNVPLMYGARAIKRGSDR